MTLDISEYTRQTAVLLRAAERFQDSLGGDEADQEFTARDLLRAASMDAARDEVLGFHAVPGVQRPSPHSVAGGLRAVLYDMQSANLLLAGGMQKKEVPANGDATLWHAASQQIATTRDLLAVAAVPTGFASTLSVRSPDPSTATQAFQNYSGLLLDEIVAESGKTINTACKGLTNLDAFDIATALARIGEAVPIVVDVGRLVRRGMEKLKRTIEALAALFGKEAFERVKDAIREVWNRFSALDTFLPELLGVHEVKARIIRLLAVETLIPAAVDRATNTLPSLAGDFAQNSRILRALVYAIDLSAVLLTTLHFTGPWFLLALGVAYLSIIGGALLIGGDYTGGRPLLSWIRGIDEQLAQSIAQGSTGG